MAVEYNKRTHRNGELRLKDAGQDVVLAGWVNSYRDHGGMVFIDLRDARGITQVKFNPDTDPSAHKTARELRNEDVIAVRGTVAPRGENINPKLPTGEIEVNGHEVDLLSKSATVPVSTLDPEEPSLPHPENIPDSANETESANRTAATRVNDLKLDMVSPRRGDAGV